jgi:hypothetical protein
MARTAEIEISLVVNGAGYDGHDFPTIAMHSQAPDLCARVPVPCQPGAAARLYQARGMPVALLPSSGLEMIGPGRAVPLGIFFGAGISCYCTQYISEERTSAVYPSHMLSRNSLSTNSYFAFFCLLSAPIPHSHCPPRAAARRPGVRD